MRSNQSLMGYSKLQIRIRDIRQNKTDRVRKLLSIQQCLDCSFYDRQTEIIQPHQSYAIFKSASKECPNPECKSRNFAAVISEEDVEPFSTGNIMGKKQGKYGHIRLEGTPYPDEGGCTCGPFKDEWEVKAFNPGEGKNWEPTLTVQNMSSLQ